MTINLYTPKTKEEIQKIENLLLSLHGTQIKDVWKVGLCLGLRIDELLPIEFKDINNDTLQLKIYKTRNNNTSIIHITPRVKEIILSIRNRHPMDEFVFQSHNKLDIKNKVSKPISKQAIHEAFKNVGEILNMKISPNSMRHTAVKNAFKYI